MILLFAERGDEGCHDVVVRREGHDDFVAPRGSNKFLPAVNG